MSRTTGKLFGAITFAILAVSSLAIADKPEELPKPRRVPAQQPAIAVTCDVFEVWATHGKGAADPAINKVLLKRLENSLKQTEFKLQSSTKAALPAKKAESIKLAKGTATITLIETVNKSQVRLTVDFNAAKGNSKQTTLVSAGDYVIVSANQSNAPNAEAHVLAVGSCK
ncbi:MAG: hypothetical protein H0V17_31330 [Deltaproteobacteria bacterium]|nr:hypothetical protein [Deltaproteobacteria bacterium]